MLRTAASDQRRRDIIAIALALLDGMGRRHPFAIAIDDEARQRARRLGTGRQGAILPIGLELIMYDLPKLGIDDRLVLARVAFVLVRDLAAVKPAVQHQVKRAARKSLPAGKRAPGSLAPFAHNPQAVKLGFGQGDRAKFRTAPEDEPDGYRLGFVDDEFGVLDVIAERHIAAHPHALCLRRGDLVADALAGDLALELGKGEQHVEGQAPHRSHSVKLLGHRDEVGVIGIEHIDNLREIGERPSEAVDLVDDNNPDLASLDIGEELLERRPLQRAAGEAALVIHVRERRHDAGS